MAVDSRNTHYIRPQRLFLLILDKPIIIFKRIKMLIYTLALLTLLFVDLERFDLVSRFALATFKLQYQMLIVALSCVASILVITTVMLFWLLNIWKIIIETIMYNLFLFMGVDILLLCELIPHSPLRFLVASYELAIHLTKWSFTAIYDKAGGEFHRILQFHTRIQPRAQRPMLLLFLRFLHLYTLPTPKSEILRLLYEIRHQIMRFVYDIDPPGRDRKSFEALGITCKARLLRH